MILSSKLLKSKEQMKGQEEKKESVLGSIKKYQAEDKGKPKEKKEAFKEAERGKCSSDFITFETYLCTI